MSYRIVQYNNKSRKGTYIVIGKGQQRRILKYDTDTPPELYEQAVTEQLHWREIHNLTDTYTYAQGRRDKKQHKKISEQLQKGTRHYTTTLHELTREGKVRDAYRKLIRPLVKSDKIYDILYSVRERLKPYLNYHATIEGTTDTHHGMTKLGGWYQRDLTIEEFVQIYHNNERLRNNSTLNQGQLRNLLTKNGVHTESITDDILGEYYDQQRTKQGTIKKVTVRIEAAV